MSDDPNSYFVVNFRPKVPKKEAKLSFTSVSQKDELKVDFGDDFPTRLISFGQHSSVSHKNIISPEPGFRLKKRREMYKGRSSTECDPFKNINE